MAGFDFVLPKSATPINFDKRRVHLVSTQLLDSPSTLVMSSLLQPLRWTYHEFGLVSIQQTGRNAYLILAARSMRMLAHGAISLILALFLSALEFPDYSIGAFLSATLLGDIILGGFLTLIADRLGRRKVLMLGSLLMVMSGTIFAYFKNYWILLLAAIFGVISATGGDFGPFRSIEESILSHLTDPSTRADVLAWYVTTSTLGYATGSEIGGRIVHALENRGFELVDAYHSLFYLYIAMGLVNLGLSSLLTSDCELEDSTAYSQVPQEENDEAIELPEAQAALPSTPPLQEQKHWHQRLWTLLTGRLSQISRTTLIIMLKLWFLLAVDSLADGLVPYALTNYYIEENFRPSKATLGDINGVAHLLGGISTVFAGPLARRIGLVNTMVFTHTPSSAAVLLFPLPSNFALTVILLFIRAGLNSLDQAPRSAFIAAVVKPEERTAALGITAMVRTTAAMIGPTLTGVLAHGKSFWIAFVIAGSCRLSYDFGLYALFVNLKLYQNEGTKDTIHASGRSPRISDEDFTELDDLAGSVKSDNGDKTNCSGSSSEESKSPNLAPRGGPLRRRSPSPLAKANA